MQSILKFSTTEEVRSQAGAAYLALPRPMPRACLALPAQPCLAPAYRRTPAIPRLPDTPSCPAATPPFPPHPTHPHSLPSPPHPGHQARQPERVRPGLGHPLQGHQLHQPGVPRPQGRHRVGQHLQREHRAPGPLPPLHCQHRWLPPSWPPAMNAGLAAASQRQEERGLLPYNLRSPSQRAALPITSPACRCTSLACPLVRASLEGSGAGPACVPAVCAGGAAPVLSRGLRWGRSEPTWCRVRRVHEPLGTLRCLKFAGHPAIIACVLLSGLSRRPPAILLQAATSPAASAATRVHVSSCFCATSMRRCSSLLSSHG